MDTEKIKQKVKEAFSEVDSEAFLQIKIKEGIKKHQQNFTEFKTLHPDQSFAHWKQRNIDNVNLNSTNNTEIMAIGIFLLALDEFNPE